MGKTENEGAKKAPSQAPATKSPNTRAASKSPATSIITVTTTSALAKDPTIGYRVRVLLYDFINVMKDPNSEKRINSTTNEYYISDLYFDETQAATLKAAIIDIDLSELDEADDMVQLSQGQSFETAAQALLSNFIDKRRASGDARPCGPHHLAPIYARFFGINMDELKDAKFLCRLSRAGV
jgi:hypothetical protein